MPPKQRATRNSQHSRSPPLGADADGQHQRHAAPAPPMGATSSTAGSEEATDSSWTDVVTTGSASAKSTRTRSTDIITTNNNISPPTTSTPIRRGPVKFSEHPDLADTSDPPDIGGDSLLLDNGGPETSVSTTIVASTTSDPSPSTEGSNTSAPILSLPPEGMYLNRAGDGGEQSSPSLLLTGNMDDPSTMTLDQILVKLTILDKLSE